MMLHPVLKNKIDDPIIALIYASKIGIKEPKVRVELFGTIKKIRLSVIPKTTDALAMKLVRYGNNGGWYKAVMGRIWAGREKARKAEQDKWRKGEYKLRYNMKTGRHYVDESKPEQPIQLIYLKDMRKVV